MDALDVSVLALLQGGESVGKQLREHWDDALRKIDTGGAFAGLAIHFASRGSEVRDVRDVDAEEPVPRFLVAHQRNSVIVITSIRRIDGDDQLAREVLASA